MKNKLRNIAVLALIAAATLPATAAQAQYCGGCYTQPAPFYPYAVWGEPLYAIDIEPNFYAIRRAAPLRDYPYVSGIVDPAPEQNTPALGRPREPADYGLYEELRQRSRFKRTVINTKKLVYDPPVIIETKRVVDDPPRVIVRHHFVDEPIRSRRKHVLPMQRRD